MTDLSKLLKNCEGQQFYSSVFDHNVTLDVIVDSNKDKYPLKFSFEEIINGVNRKFYFFTSKEGILCDEVIIFPSKDNKDWSTFKPTLKLKVGNDYIIAYKGIRKDRYSEYNFQYQYLPNETYECHCNCNLDEKNSFGLSAWTYKEAQKHSDIVIKVKIHIDDLGAVIHDGNKLRCKKFTVLT